MPFLRLRNLSVEFPVYQGGSQSRKKIFWSPSPHRAIWRATQWTASNARAPNDVTLDIENGDRLRPDRRQRRRQDRTLLRILAGIYSPTRGELHSIRKVSALLDVSVGLNPEATGRENIILRGMYMNIHPRGDALARGRDRGVH